MPAPTKRARASAPMPSGKRIKLGGTPAYKASTVAASTKKRVELKRLTDQMYTGTISGNGIVLPFPVVEAGNEDDERDGRAIEWRGWEVMFSYIPTNLLDYEKIRALVVLWKGLPAVPSSVSDLLDTGTWANVFGMYDIKVAENVEIISDKIYDCNSNSTINGTTTFCRNTALVHAKGTKKFTQTFRSSAPDLNLADGAHLYLVLIPLVGGGLSSVVGATTFIDI